MGYDLYDVRDLWRTFGLKGLVRRAAWMFAKKAGVYARRPAPDAGLAGPLPVLSDAAVRAFYAARPDVAAQARAEAEALRAGRFTYFSARTFEMGFPPDWYRHPITGVAWPAVHWSRLSDNDPARGDIKWIWEPGRFGALWAFLRARAAGDAAAAEAGWALLDDFFAENPPYIGAQWWCGQETAFKVFAVLWWLGLTADDAAATPARTAAARRFLAAAERKIADGVAHALSQRNNHAISELAALAALAAWFPDRPGALRNSRRAERLLRECLADQFAADGAYSQQSFVYARLALQVLLWLRAAMRAAGRPFAHDAAIERGAAFIERHLDEAGGVPNYGPNDGARVFPLSSTAFGDFRPLVTHAAAAAGRSAAVGDGLWIEEALWFGLVPHTTPYAPADGVVLTASGYVVSRRAGAVLTLRAARHTRRPGHSDNAAPELRLHGEPLLLDPGTFAYTEPAPWNNGLDRARVHNTLSVQGRDQMRKRGRFLYTRFSDARAEVRERADGYEIVVRTHADAERAVAWTRRLMHADGALVMFDAARSPVSLPLVLHLNLAGTDWHNPEPGVWRRGDVELHIDAPGAAFATRVGDPNGTQGWYAPTYGWKVPCTAVEAALTAAGVAWRTTLTWSDAGRVSAAALR